MDLSEKPSESVRCLFCNSIRLGLAQPSESPVDSRGAGGQQKYNYIPVLLAIDIINYYNKKHDCLSRVVMAKHHRWKTAKIKL